MLQSFLHQCNVTFYRNLIFACMPCLIQANKNNSEYKATKKHVSKEEEKPAVTVMVLPIFRLKLICCHNSLWETSISLMLPEVLCLAQALLSMMPVQDFGWNRNNTDYYYYYYEFFPPLYSLFCIKFYSKVLPLLVIVVETITLSNMVPCLFASFDLIFFLIELEVTTGVMYNTGGPYCGRVDSILMNRLIGAGFESRTSPGCS